MRPTSIKLAAALIVCMLVMFFDGYDLSALPLALPYLSEELGLAPTDFTNALSAVLVGLGVGALFLAPLGDRFGRRPVVLLSVFVLGLMTLGTSLSETPQAFTIWRFLTGLALGVCLPNVTALVSEISPPKHRAVCLTVISSGIAIGGILAGFLVPEIVSFGGWKAIFIWPGLFMILSVIALFIFLPETPEFVRGGSNRVKASGAIFAPFLGQYAPSMLVFAGLYTFNALALYMLLSWAPTILTQAEFSPAESSRMTSFIQLGGLFSGLLISFFLDRGRPVSALLASYSMVCIALLGFSFVVPSFYAWATLLLLAGGGIVGAHMAIMALGTGFFPPSMLSSAIGLAVAIARIGAIAGPYAGELLINAGQTGAAFFPFVIIPIALCMGLVCLVPLVIRQSDKVLETDL